MHVLEYDSPKSFADDVWEYLVADEAEHNLMLGILTRLLGEGSSPDARWDQPVFRAVEHGGEIVLASMRTPPWQTILGNSHAPGAPETLAKDLARTDPDTPGAVGRTEEAEPFARTFADQLGLGCKAVSEQRVHQLTRVIAPKIPEGTPRLVRPHEADLMLEWFVAFHNESDVANPNPPTADSIKGWMIAEADLRLWVWDVDDKPVSMVGQNAGTPNGARIGPVYTPPQLRGRGFARALTAHVSQRVLDSGKQFVFLYTDLANPISNAIYAQIGYEPVCDAQRWEFRAV